MERSLGQWSLRGYGLFAVEPADGRFAGWAGILHPVDWPEPELGYSLGQPFLGQGLATEAARAARDWAFAAAWLRTAGKLHPAGQCAFHPCRGEAGRRARGEVRTARSFRAVVGSLRAWPWTDRVRQSGCRPMTTAAAGRRTRAGARAARDTARPTCSLQPTTPDARSRAVWAALACRRASWSAISAGTSASPPSPNICRRRWMPPPCCRPIRAWSSTAIAIPRCQARSPRSAN